MFSYMLNPSEWMVAATYTAAAFAVIAFFRICQTLIKLNVTYNNSEIHSSLMVELRMPQQEGPIEFSLAEIEQATKDFDDSLIIRQDVYGPLYSGVVRNTSMLIKRLTLAFYPTVFAQVKYMSKFRHCNVVNVLGYCCENGHKMIVYEYLAGFTLRQYLHSYFQFTFERMVSVALGAAKGLQYLHNLTPPFAHSDFSAAKVLLDANFNVKVSDAGISRLLYLTIGLPSFDESGDVFSFGLMLLEMLSGEEPIGISSNEDLFEWMDSRICSKTLLERIMKGTYTMEALQSFITVTLNCLRFPAGTRPKMVEVVTELEKILTHLVN